AAIAPAPDGRETRRRGQPGAGRAPATTGAVQPDARVDAAPGRAHAAGGRDLSADPGGQHQLQALPDQQAPPGHALRRAGQLPDRARRRLLLAVAAEDRPALPLHRAAPGRARRRDRPAARGDPVARAGPGEPGAAGAADRHHADGGRPGGAAGLRPGVRGPQLDPRPGRPRPGLLGGERDRGDVHHRPDRHLAVDAVRGPGRAGGADRGAPRHRRGVEARHRPLVGHLPPRPAAVPAAGADGGPDHPHRRYPEALRHGLRAHPGRARGLDGVRQRLHPAGRLPDLRPRHRVGAGRPAAGALHRALAGLHHALLPGDRGL
ncbi:MAG: Various polyols ABC transporter, permease component 1, partial [uncultured Thermomicrobiales bacterium]